MKQLISIIFSLALLQQPEAQTITGFASPESVNTDGHFLYVTNIGPTGNPTAKDGDGFISKLSFDGKLLVRNISKEKLDGPKGTAFIDGVLYVADIDRIVGIAVATGEKVSEVDLSGFGTTFANDLAVKDRHTLFASATDIGKIFEVDLRAHKAKVIADLKGANGICYDKANNRLYGCGFVVGDLTGGRIIAITWQQKKAVVRQIANFGGAFDGLALLDDHTLVISDWVAVDHAAGFIEKIDLHTNRAVRLSLPPMFGPADFYLDSRQMRLIIPIMEEGKITIAKITPSN